MGDSKGGFSLPRLRNVDDYLKRIIDQGEVAGAGALIWRHGEEAYCKSFGARNREKSIPMTNDTIYRIFSMSKTFTIVTAMTLYEKGLFKLHDPIGEFIPAFKDTTVAAHDERGQVQIVPAKSPITFEHLFTMTSGIPYPGPGSYSAKAAADQIAQLKGERSTRLAAEMMARIPLCFHPGEYWMYGFSHDVLGALIEVLSGKTLGAYMQEAVLEPLGLSDTAFFVPEEKRPRLAVAYEWTETGLKEKTDLDPVPLSPPAFESGGGGLCSTLHDVGRYGCMLLSNGKWGDARILSRKTLELIRRNHIDPSQQLKRFGFPSQAGYGYGLGVRTMTDTAAAGLNGSPGEWAWDGMLGTWYCVDPAEDMVAVFLIQRYPGANENLPKRFAQTVYGAIDD
ncbi:MAG: beta-lactamase family protein [Treponema sp.]|jgi:CubicO group peptidase (beta-lactamase class C family)|nr:beta-lactamase family protein [Treponema sp.]